MDPVYEQQVIRDVIQQNGPPQMQEPTQRGSIHSIQSRYERAPHRAESNSSFDNVYGNRDLNNRPAAGAQRPSSSFEKIFGSPIGGGSGDYQPTAFQRNRFYHMKSDIFNNDMSPEVNQQSASARLRRNGEVTGKITQANTERGDSAYEAGESSRSDSFRKNTRESSGNPLNMIGYGNSPRRTCRKHFAQSYH